MPGLGTIVNTAAIVVGGLLGMFAGSFLKERYQETVLKAMGFAIIVMALGSTLANMLVVTFTSTDPISAKLDTQGTVMMIVSLALGAVLGEVVDLHGKFETFGTWLRDKTGNQGDSGFINAFVSASLTVCVGAMAIIGSIQDGVAAQHDTLFAKALLDLIIIMMMTASMGKGCIFAAIPVFVFQGAITLLAGFISPVITDAMLSNISYVGNVLILCVGVNLVWPNTIRVANVLPALLVAIVFALF
jgi:hypothetical protein